MQENKICHIYINMDIYDDKITIDMRDDICTVCCKHYKHRKRYGMWAKEDTARVKEVELITAHAGCRHLMEQKEQVKAKLLDIEWRLYAMKI